ncbi:MAG: insulinase family protein, partial [Planctomycetaceae bacterium]
MMYQDIHTHTYANGLTLLVEPMADVQSAAFAMLVPGGSVYDPPGENGTAAVLCELMVRGAGDRDSKELSTALDNLGVQRGESARLTHLAFAGAILADNLP